MIRLQNFRAVFIYAIYDSLSCLLMILKKEFLFPSLRFLNLNKIYSCIFNYM